MTAECFEQIGVVVGVK